MKIIEKIKQKYRQERNYIWSHHPICEAYKDHTVGFGKVRLCIGCYVGYPAAILGILSTIFLFQDRIDPLILMILANLCLFSAIWSKFGWTKKKGIKITQKFLFGFGSGIFLSSGILFLEFELWVRILVVAIIYINLNAIMFFVHYRSHQKICKQCTLPKQGKYCPGYPPPEPNLAESAVGEKS